AERLFFVGLWNFADDCGHVEDEPVRLKLQILPNDEVDARKLIETLISVGLLERRKGCLLLPNFRKHQKIDKPSTCRFDEDSTKAPRGLARKSRTSKSPPPRKGREGKGGERKEEPSPTPTESGPSFEDFWNQYPIRNGSKGSKKTARAVWSSLGEAKRTMALVSLPLYKRVAGAFPRDAERYLKSEMWEGLEEPTSNGHAPGDRYQDFDEAVKR
ncbi:MAG TPA: hypothetical protein VJ837_03950, partial [Candidatus Paceibacterota bacterium]|nr:hypothetical protein [Candidatus Paceibacterota bacterium]